MIEGHVRGAMGIKVYDTLSGLMFYSFDMPIFFFVSGFLAYKSCMTAREISYRIRNKFIYLIIPAIVFKFFSDLLVHNDFLDVICNGFGGYWFTITLFERFLLYYLVLLICSNETIGIIVLILLAIASVGMLSIYGEIGPKIIDFNHLTKYFQYFVFGVLAMKYRPKFEMLIYNDVVKSIVIVLFFTILFLMNYDIKPIVVHHLLRDLVLRYLGTFVILSFFVSKANVFNKTNKINSIILCLGRNSLAIYLLQYFFIPHLPMGNNTDIMLVHVMSFTFTLIIVGVCMIFIYMLSYSSIVRKYILGQK